MELRAAHDNSRPCSCHVAFTAARCVGACRMRRLQRLFRRHEPTSYRTHTCPTSWPCAARWPAATAAAEALPCTHTRNAPRFPTALSLKTVSDASCSVACMDPYYCLEGRLEACPTIAPSHSPAGCSSCLGLEDALGWRPSSCSAWFGRRHTGRSEPGDAAGSACLQGVRAGAVWQIKISTFSCNNFQQHC